MIVKAAEAGTKFVTLDGVERTLTDRDLMICNVEEPMCTGGVFGGLDSGVDGSSDHRRILGIRLFPSDVDSQDRPSFWLEHGRFFPLRAWFGSEQYDVCIETCRLVDTRVGGR